VCGVPSYTDLTLLSFKEFSIDVTSVLLKYSSAVETALQKSMAKWLTHHVLATHVVFRKRLE
jgi:hypothetical protein